MMKPRIRATAFFLATTSVPDNFPANTLVRAVFRNTIFITAARIGVDGGVGIGANRAPFRSIRPHGLYGFKVCFPLY